MMRISCARAVCTENQPTAMMPKSEAAIRFIVFPPSRKSIGRYRGSVAPMLADNGSMLRSIPPRREFRFKLWQSAAWWRNPWVSFLSPHPAARRAHIHMGKLLAGIHSHAASDDLTEADGHRVVVDIGQVNVESTRLDVLRVLRRAFDVRVGCRR